MHLPVQDLVPDDDNAGGPWQPAAGPLQPLSGVLLRAVAARRPAGALQGRVAQLVRRRVGAVPPLEGWVQEGVAHAAEGGVALVVERAIRQAKAPEESPDVAVGPIDYGVDPHEGRPAIRRRREGIDIGHPWVAMPLSHDHSPHTACDEVLHALAERALLDRHHPEIKAVGHPIDKALDTRELVRRVEEDGLGGLGTSCQRGSQCCQPKVKNNARVLATVEGNS
mmetsp:Transcript_29488/g.80962  ORF Transcript_29488/g.80962 Transcript_29488/m.80962 type:complete len:224 (+) Transcript_29488:956-1627(+)